MKVEAEQGYLIVAANNSSTDYIACARVLAKSIKFWSPDAKVCLLTDKEVEEPIFDFVKTFPYGDVSQSEWKLSNDWQAFWASPFRQTIKLEADMVLTGNIDHWWSMLQHRDVVVSQSCRNFKNEVSSNRYYRKIFDTNGLPDLYNAITYWRMSKDAQEFFLLVKEIFTNWEQYKTVLKGAYNEEATTDVAYALAASIIGVERVTLPGTTYPMMIHMKSKVNGLTAEDWRKQLVWELDRGVLRINTIAQKYPFHYHVKEFAQELEPLYDKLLGRS